MAATACLAQAYAQEATPYKNFIKSSAVEVQLGSSIFLGDVKQYRFLPDLQKRSELGIGGGLRFVANINHYLALRADAGLLTLKGNNYPNQVDYTRNRPQSVYFSNNASELALNALVNFKNLFAFSAKPLSKINVFGLAGIGVLNYQSAVYNEVDNKTINTSKATSLIYPVGLILKYRLSPTIDIGIESSYRFCNSDLVDAVNVDNNVDNYLYSNVHIAFKLGKKADNYTWRKFVSKELVSYTATNVLPDSGYSVIKSEELLKKMQPDTVKIPVTYTITKVDTLIQLVEKPAKKQIDPDFSLPSVFFEFNQIQLSALEEEKLKEVAYVLASDTEGMIYLIGHSDDIGKPAANNRVALKRAQTIKAFLVKQVHIPANRIVCQSVSNNAAVGRRGANIINRRVDIRKQQN